MQSIIHRQPACRIEGFDKLRSMRQPLDQVTIGILEHRFTKEFATLLQRFGASVYACPMLEERNVEKRKEVEQYVGHDEAGEVDFSIFLSVARKWCSDAVADFAVIQDEMIGLVRTIRSVVCGPS